jgi:hypothetical protein|uniref:Uncharacterized protein n=1 Tax=Thermomicrobium roseum TaxID=500 RepID=A0A7C1JUX9_THERO
MLSALLLLGAEALSGRRPDRHEPSRWYSRLLSAALCLIEFVLIGYSVWHDPWPWMDDPLIAGVQAVLIAAFLWPWLTLLTRRRASRTGSGSSACGTA